jgi:hypothetical protein
MRKYIGRITTIVIVLGTLIVVSLAQWRGEQPPNTVKKRPDGSIPVNQGDKTVPGSADMTFVVASPEPGILQMSASCQYTERVRVDPQFWYRIRVNQLVPIGKLRVYEHTHDNPKEIICGDKGKPITIRLPQHQIELPPGVYQVIAEIHQDAGFVDPSKVAIFDGKFDNIITDSYVVRGALSPPIVVN